MSPVWSHPSRTVSAVASGFFQYPAMTFSPRMTISPFVPRGTSFPSSSRIFRSSGMRILPDEPKRCQWCLGELVEMTGVASESPYPWNIGMPMA